MTPEEAKAKGYTECQTCGSLFKRASKETADTQNLCLSCILDKEEAKEAKKP